MNDRAALAALGLLALAQAAALGVLACRYRRQGAEAEALIRLGERMARRACCPTP